MLNDADIAGVLANREIVPTLCEDIKKILTRHAGTPMRHRRRTTKHLSSETQRLRMYTVVSSMEQLYKLGFKIEYARSFQERHVRTLVAHWVEQGLSGPTMDNKINYLRWFATVQGRSNMIGALEDYLPDGFVLNRSRIAVRDKTFTGNGIDPVEVIQQAMELDPRVGFILLFEHTFGLRIAEAAKMRIAKRLDESLRSIKLLAAPTLLVSNGAKNGRSREIPIESIAQLDVLAAALPLVNSPHGSLIPFGKQWSTWRHHVYRQFHRLGLKRNGEQVLGLTSHSFRHEHLNGLFYRVTGQPSPVQGGRDFDPSLYEMALAAVTERAGHNDRYKAGAYLSTPRMQLRLSKNQRSLLEE